MHATAVAMAVRMSGSGMRCIGMPCLHPIARPSGGDAIQFCIRVAGTDSTSIQYGFQFRAYFKEI